MTVIHEHHTGGYVELIIFLPVGCLLKTDMPYSQRCYISSLPFAIQFSHSQFSTQLNTANVSF